MESDSTSPPPEASYLCDFAPVPRRCERRDGWTAERQLDFIAFVAVTGSQLRDGHAVGLTARGAYQLRHDAGAEGFVRAWDAAVAFYKAWTGGPGPRPPAAAPPDPAPEDPETEERAKDEALDRILEKYLIKLSMERKARLDGRIVEADFYVRQLSWLEVALDLGGRGQELLLRLRRGGLHSGEIVATPMSVLLDQARRLYWKEEGGPERPPPPPLGDRDGEVGSGPPLECQYSPERDGPWKDWQARGTEAAALAAEAQAAWEEKARADAAAWRARLEREDPDALAAAPAGPREDRGADGTEAEAPEPRP